MMNSKMINHKISMIHFLSIIFLLSIFLFSKAKASQLPDKCPSVEAIIANKLDRIERVRNGWIGIKEKNRYDTNEFWSLLTFFPIQAENNQEALILSIEALKSLHFKEGPKEG